MHLLLLLRSHGTGPPPYNLEGPVRTVMVGNSVTAALVDTRLAATVIDTRLAADVI